MTNYLLLSSHPGRSKYSQVTRFDCGGTDIRPLLRGERIEANLLSPVRVEIGTGDFPDLLPCPMGILIGTTKFVDILDDFANEHEVQILDAPISIMRTGLPVHGYYIVNPLQAFQCLTQNRPSMGVCVENLLLYRENIPDGVHFFRPKDMVGLTLISSELDTAFRDAKLKRLYTLPIPSVYAQGSP